MTIGGDEQDAYARGVLDEVKAHDRYFTRQMGKYRAARVVVIGSAALVPVLTSVPAVPVAVLGALGAVAAVVESWIQLFRWRDSGLAAQQLSGKLGRELALYSYEAAPYDNAEAFSLFVQRVEALKSRGISAFNDLWGDDRPPSASADLLGPAQDPVRQQASGGQPSRS